MKEIISQIKHEMDRLCLVEKSASNYYGADGSGHAGYQLSEEVTFMFQRHIIELEQMIQRLQSFEQRCKNDAVSRDFD